MEEEEKNDYLGWIIEWKTLSSTSRQRGIVIDWNKKRNKLIVIEDTNPSTGNMIEIPIKRTQIIKIKPGDVTDIQIKLNIEKKIQKIEKSDQDAYEILSQILHGLEKKGIDPHKALYSAIEKKSESTEKVSEDKRMPSVVEIPISEDESGSEDNSESDDDGSEDSEEEGDEDDDNDDEENDEEEEDSGEAEEVEDEEDEDEDEDEDDEEDEDEDDEDDESENEIEDEEEDEEEDEKSEEEVDEESENDSSSDDEDEDEDRIDVKVYIHLPADMTANHVPLMSTTQTNSIIIRAFNINKYKMISKITHLLTSDYQRKPVLYYRDREGDEITLSNNSDMKNILKLHEKEHNKKKSYERKLKLIAKFPPSSPTKLLLPEEKEFRTQQTRQVESVWSQSTNLWGRRWENTQTQFDNRDTNTASIESFQNGEFVWQKGDLIGSGSFGQVYSAIHLTTGNKMAVKEVYLSGTKGHREQAEALKTEIKVLSALDHPHIIKYYGGMKYLLSVNK